jgi:hypothetical protein
MARSLPSSTPSLRARCSGHSLVRYMICLVLLCSGFFSMSCQQPSFWLRTGGQHMNPPTPASFYCNRNALSPGEREKYNQLTDTLASSAEETRELADGYQFRVSSDYSLSDLSEWMSYERKCCPFFTFEMELGRNNGPVWLRLRGEDGVKTFIRAEFPTLFQKSGSKLHRFELQKAPE